MGKDSLMVSPIEGDFDLDIPMCESPLSDVVRGKAGLPAKPVFPAKPGAIQTTPKQTALTPTRAQSAPKVTKPAPSTSSSVGLGIREPPSSTAAATPHSPPRVTSVVPSTFVPIESDLSLPFNPPRNRVERAEGMLQTLDYYRTGVRRGIMYLAALDRQRILAEQDAADERAAAAIADAEQKVATAAAAAKAADAADAALTATMEGLAWADTKPAQKEQKEQKAQAPETATPSPHDPGPADFVPRDELDAMIATMRAPAIPGVDYNVAPEHMAQAHPLVFQRAPVGEPADGRRDHVRQLDEVVEQALTQLSGFEMHMKMQLQHWTSVLEWERKVLDEQSGMERAVEDVAMTGT